MPEAKLPSSAAIARLNDVTEDEARSALERCCGARRWVDAMLAARPFASARSLLDRAESIWLGLEPSDYLEAFAHHPEIGENLDELRRRFGATADLSQAEQAGAASASEAVLSALQRQNRAYRERFGHVFIVCASGKSAEAMLALLEQRLENAPATELHIAAAEQAQITRLRLEKLPS
jgi:2-oxo-4-hydroxy-4-carboxy-5-ureidoimidazoline decarboxylase